MQVKSGLKCFVYLQIWHQNFFQNFITSCNFLKYDQQNLLQDSFSIKVPKLCYKSRDEVLVSGLLSVMANFKEFFLGNKAKVSNSSKPFISIHNISSRLWSCYSVSGHPQFFLPVRYLQELLARGIFALW